MVGHPEDVDDLLQGALLKAYEKLSSFRGDSDIGTWFCSIGSRLAIDHLRGRKRWRERAQVIFASSCLESEETAAEVGQAMSDPSFTYDVNEHIAYCFACVGRTLEPEAQAALILRDVLEMSNDEAAKALGLSRSILRHHLARARTSMQERFEGLCALVNKQGVCWQCYGLREALPPPQRGPEVPQSLSWSDRLRIVRDAPLGDGASQAMHAVFFRHTAQQEEEERGDADTQTDCGRPEREGAES